MATIFDTATIHDLALATFHHLKELGDSSARKQHIFRMICAIERAAAGILDETGYEHAAKDIEAAAVFCQS
jgi:hypothetical protein